MKLELYCLNCKSSNNIRINITQPYNDCPMEVWLICKCGEEYLLGEDGDIV